MVSKTSHFSEKTAKKNKVKHGYPPSKNHPPPHCALLPSTWYSQIRKEDYQFSVVTMHKINTKQLIRKLHSDYRTIFHGVMGKGWTYRVYIL